MSPERGATSATIPNVRIEGRAQKDVALRGAPGGIRTPNLLLRTELLFR